MRINTNVTSLNAQESSVNTNKNLTTSLEKLSSGLRINKASDDASGLTIADRLRTQATSIKAGISNANSTITLLQIADKSMSEQSNILDTIKAKLIQANTSTTSVDGRESIRKDVNKLLNQFDNIAKQTNYNGLQLISGADGISATAAMSFQVGEDTTSGIITLSSIQSNTTGIPIPPSTTALTTDITSTGTYITDVNANISGSLNLGETIDVTGNVTGNINTGLGNTGSHYYKW